VRGVWSGESEREEACSEQRGQVWQRRVTCAESTASFLGPRESLLMQQRTVKGGKSSSSSCGYCERKPMDAPRDVMSKSMAKRVPVVASPPE
jgi:hypothetical protein